MKITLVRLPTPAVPLNMAASIAHTIQHSIGMSDRGVVMKSTPEDVLVPRSNTSARVPVDSTSDSHHKLVVKMRVI